MALQIICIPSAFKHDVTEADIQQAFKTAKYDRLVVGFDNKYLLLGRTYQSANTKGNPLEVMYNDLGESRVAVSPAVQPAGLTEQPSNFTGQPASLVEQMVGLTGQQANLVGQSANFTGQPVDLIGKSVDLTGQPVDFTGQSANLTEQPVNLSGTSLYKKEYWEPSVPFQIKQRRSCGTEQGVYYGKRLHPRNR